MSIILIGMPYLQIYLRNYLNNYISYEDGIYDLYWDWNSTNGYVGGLPVIGILVTVVFYWSETIMY